VSKQKYTFFESSNSKKIQSVRKMYITLIVSAASFIQK